MASQAPKKIRIGDLLVSNGLITEEQLQTALQTQSSSGHKLGRVLVDLELIEEKQLLELLSEQLGYPFIDLKSYDFDMGVVHKIPEAQARRFRVILLKDENGAYQVGMADPTDIFVYDDLNALLDKPIEPCIVKESDLLDALDLVYRQTHAIASLAEELDDELAEDDAFDLSELATASTDSDAPVVRLLQKIFEEAIKAKASDIHIEPDEHVVRVRKRIDGVLFEQVMKEKRITAALVVRLKLMSGLDISEKRRPQDGRFNIRALGRDIDVRLSTMPVQFGESVVMRLLDHTDGVLPLEKVGMPEDLVERFRKAINRPHGLVLITGPTGSGKTTTLYGGLQELNTPEKKIITVEDPVEYRLPRISQVQINDKIGLHFSTVLKSTLRQDPDILLVGEIRDAESAEIALRAAMTGHMVFSTLHTNDALTSALRLIDMGVDGYLVAAALKVIVAQRLIRRVCESCKQEYIPEMNECQWLQAIAPEIDFKETKFFHGEGCLHCQDTGYRGRVGVFEMLNVAPDMARALQENSVAGFTSAAKRQEGFKPLSHCAMEYALEGVTSLEEVMRVSVLVEDESVSDELSMAHLAQGAHGTPGTGEQGASPDSP